MSLPQSSFFTQPDEIRAVVRQLQQETILFTLPFLYGAGLLLLIVAGFMADPLYGGLPALSFFLLTFLVWRLLQLAYLAAAWVLVGGCLAITFMIVVWGQLDVAICLLILPIGLATHFIGLASGVTVATVCTLLLFYAQRTWLTLDPALCLVTVLGSWSVVGLIWLTAHPLLTTARWFWVSHKESRQAIEVARDYQEQLGRLVEDLADANLQLTRLNRAAAATRQAAEDARNAKEQFVANVSHELRTPLNMIIGFSEMITQTPDLYGATLPPTLLADLDVILRNSQHLARLIDDVLDLSQIEAGRMALTRERIALQEIIDAAITAVQPLFVSKGLYLQTELEANMPALFCDRTRIRQVVLNLLSNAGRFTEQGGVLLQAKCEDAFITVSITDTGVGIPADAIERLFQPFQQLDGSLRRRAGGSGLGLSISKRFIELHEGQMWVKSQEGVGTTFFFRLPIDPLPRLEERATRWLNPEWEFRQHRRPATTPPPLLRPRFVVLESEDALQRLLRRYLDGVEVVGTTTLPDAIQALTAAPALALLLNDTAWPENFQQITTAIEWPANTPLILCSIPGIHEVTNALGVADYLVKPVARRKLLTALESLPLNNRTVLIVDDEPEALHLYRRMLTSVARPYRVLRASSGQEALELLATHHPGALLLDLVMPNMDGFRLLAAKEQNPLLRTIPTIILTARDPTGQPTVSNALAVTQRGGLSVAQLLACIEAVSGILSTSGQTGGLAQPKKRVD